MVITRWKDSRILQTVSTIKKPGVQTIDRQVGAEIIKVKCPSDIMEYQKHMGGADRGDQHRVMGAGFANVTHFKKWYKKVFMGIADFSFLQAFAAWNLSVEKVIQRPLRSDKKLRIRLLKWQGYAVAAEEFMSYVDEDEANPAAESAITSLRNHTPKRLCVQKVSSLFDLLGRGMCCKLCSSK